MENDDEHSSGFPPNVMAVFASATHKTAIKYADLDMLVKSREFAARAAKTEKGRKTLKQLSPPFLELVTKNGSKTSE